MMQFCVAIAIFEFDISIFGIFVRTFGAVPLLDRPIALTLVALFDH